MKRFLFLGAGSLALLLALGCSQESSPPDSGGRLLSADQIHLLSPGDFRGKDRAIDAMGDFTLSVMPGEESVFDGASFSLKAPAGCVSTPITIQAQWLGEQADGAIGFNFTPEGQEFLLPLEFEISVPLQSQDVPTGQEPMVLYDREDGWYEVVSNEVHWLQQEERVVLKAPLEHFTKYLLGTGPPPDPEPHTN